MSSRNLDSTLDESGVNTGVVDTATAGVRVPSQAKDLTIYMLEASGDITGLAFSVECSPDKVVWFKTEDVVPVRANRGNFVYSFAMNAGDFVRLVVSTKSTGASTVDFRYAFK